jgi:hypothetical protein
MNSLGVIGAFEEGAESWQLYQERLEQFFIVNKVTDASEKRAILLSACGRKTFHLVSGLLAPKKTSETTAFADICAKLKAHYDPQVSEIVQRFKFYKRVRRHGESVVEFLADLRDLASGCNFDDKLDSMLRDGLVMGINDEGVQRKLLAEENLTLPRAVSIAQAQESAMKGSELMARAEVVDHVHDSAGDVRKESKNSRKCYRCLSTRHLAAKCPFIDKRCFNCSLVGHAAAACKSQESGQKQKQRQGTHQVQEEEEEVGVYSLHQVEGQQQREPPITMRVEIDGKAVVMEIDTGAYRSLISAETFASVLGSQPPLKPARIRLQTYSGEQIPVEGKIEVCVRVPGGEVEQLELLVVGGDGSSLLGRNWLKRLSPNLWTVGQVKEDAGQSSRLRHLLSEYSDVFDEGLGTYTGPPVSLKLKAEAKPRFLKARNVPFALKEKVESQLQREIEQGILVPVEYSKFASPIVPVLKADGSVRICADFKQTLNPNIETDSYPLPRIEELFSKLTGGQRFSKLDLSQA